MCCILCSSPFFEATNHPIRRLCFLQPRDGLDRMLRCSPAAQRVPTTVFHQHLSKEGSSTWFQKLGAVFLFPDSRRLAFIAGHGFMSNAGPAWNWHQSWWCGLEQPRSQVAGPACKFASRANVAKLASRANLYTYVHPRCWTPSKKGSLIFIVMNICRSYCWSKTPRWCRKILAEVALALHSWSRAGNPTHVITSQSTPTPLPLLHLTLLLLFIATTAATIMTSMTTMIFMTIMIIISSSSCHHFHHHHHHHLMSTINFECRGFYVFFVNIIVSLAGWFVWVPLLCKNPTCWFWSPTRGLESAAVAYDRFAFLSGYPGTKELRQTALFYAARQGHANTIRQGHSKHGQIFKPCIV